MQIFKILLRLALVGAILLIVSNCAEEVVENKEVPQQVVSKKFPDLSLAIQKRVEKKPEEAIEILRQYDEDFPNSPKILVQLSRAHVEAGNFSLAAFRFEQALSISSSPDLIGECAEAHLRAGDLESARKRFSEYLEFTPDNFEAWLSLARILEQQGNEIQALNAFEQAKKITNSNDCLIIANLYLKKKILVQAEKWFKDAAKKENPSTSTPLVGLLKVKLLNSDYDSVETIILAIEKTFPGTLADIPEKDVLKSILVSRRIKELNDRGIVAQNSNISELAQALLEKPNKIDEPVVSNGPKFSPLLKTDDQSTEQNDNEIETDNSGESESHTDRSLADAFSDPELATIEPEPVELGWSAYLSRNYATALIHAQKAIDLDRKNSEAWRLSSQANFQLGKIKEAEMTILEAIRHNPKDLTTRMDYLSIARETLSSPRYLRELEKTHELFPDSEEILWQLARRYHLVERMPVTAGILYRRLLKIAPPESALHNQAKMELIKIQDL
jgi:tetratricopeptide (TPR) repeat protein